MCRLLCEMKVVNLLIIQDQLQWVVWLHLQLQTAEEFLIKVFLFMIFLGVQRHDCFDTG